MEEVWADRVIAELERHRQRLRQDLGRANRQLAFWSEAKADATAELARVEEAVDELHRSRHDPMVLVRTKGGAGDTYHDADEPCGWVRDRLAFRAVLWGEARRDGLKPCNACGWRADRKVLRSPERHPPAGA